jgi:predicted  nucleic acid-binding Zn-ribbon protein
LKERADGLAGDVSRANSEFEELANQARGEEKAVKDAIEKSGEAKRKVEQARQQTDQAMELVDDILSRLGM